MKKLLILIVIVIFAYGCAFLKPAIKTTNAIVSVLCEEYAASSDVGMDPEDWCKIHENVQPFIDLISTADQSTGTTRGGE